MLKITNKQHTDYCEILNNFRCSAIDIIEELTKDYKNTLAEDIDSKLNDYHTHNEDLICKLGNLRQENKQLKEQLAEQIDYKDEYYHYWQETKKELAIRGKALELACKELMPYRVNMCGGLYTIEELTAKIDNFIEQAKESMK